MHRGISIMSKNQPKLPIASAEMNDVYVRKDVYNEQSKRVEDRCRQHEKLICEVTKVQKAIDRKISATLVFVICTLVGIIVFFVTRV